MQLVPEVRCPHRPCGSDSRSVSSPFLVRPFGRSAVPRRDRAVPELPLSRAACTPPAAGWLRLVPIAARTACRAASRPLAAPGKTDGPPPRGLIAPTGGAGGVFASGAGTRTSGEARIVTVNATPCGPEKEDPRRGIPSRRSHSRGSAGGCACKRPWRGRGACRLGSAA